MQPKNTIGSIGIGWVKQGEEAVSVVLRSEMKDNLAEKGSATQFLESDPFCEISDCVE